MKAAFKSLVSPMLIIIAAVLLRLVPHEPNVAPIGAMALFGGVYLTKKQALILPLLTMFISDIFLGFHSTMPWVYGSFLLTVAIGLFLKNKTNPTNIFAASIVSSILFYLITNFGVWFSGTMYPKTMSGLMQSYIMAIPFFRNTLLGDLVYNAIFFGGYALIKSYLNSLSLAYIKKG